MTSRLAKIVCSFWVKLISGFVVFAMVLVLGFIAPYHIAGTISIGFVFAMALGFYYVSNN